MSKRDIYKYAPPNPETRLGSVSSTLKAVKVEGHHPAPPGSQVQLPLLIPLPQHRRLLPRTEHTSLVGSLGERGSTNQAERQKVRRRPGLCAVPKCPRQNCQLRSHRSYVRRGSSSAQHDSAGAFVKIEPVESDIPLDPSLSQLARIGTLSDRIERLGVNGLPKLPLAVQDEGNGEIRPLFHHFFVSVFDRLVLLFRAPPVSPMFKNGILALALRSPTYCMALIAHAKLDTLLLCGGGPQVASQPLFLYNRVMQVFRAQLGQVKVAEVDELLLTIVILCYYDIFLQKEGSLQAHREGIKTLVSLRGGIHNLGLSVAYIVHADRIISILTGQEPLFQFQIDRSIQLPRQPASKYGKAFETKPVEHALRPDVLGFCLDACRLIELFESKVQSLHPAYPRTTPLQNLDFFYFGRDRLEGQYAQLHARLRGEGSINEWVSLAAKIVEYPVNHANYIPVLAPFLCDQMYPVLESKFMLSKWSNHLDMLEWILFVMATVPGIWAGHARAVESLNMVLQAKFQRPESWPDDWRTGEWALVRRFVWSDVHLRASFERVCDELGGGGGEKRYV